MSLPSMDSANVIARLLRRVEQLERAFAEYRSSVRSLAAAYIEGPGGITTFDPATGSRTFIGRGNIQVWDDYNDNPMGFGRIYCDPGSGLNIFRIFPPYTDGDGLQNSITIQGRRPGAPGNVWVYADGSIQLRTQDQDAAPTGVIAIASLQVMIDTPQLALYSLPTTGSSANLRLDTIGGKWTVGYISSSLRYKQDVEDAEIDPAEVLALSGRTWRDRGEVEYDPDTEKRNVGFIAEELDEHPTLRQFVDYDDQGRPDAIQYDRLSVALLALAKSQQARLDDMEARLTALEAERG